MFLKLHIKKYNTDFLQRCFLLDLSTLTSIQVYKPDEALEFRYKTFSSVYQSMLLL